MKTKFARHKINYIALSCFLPFFLLTSLNSISQVPVFEYVNFDDPADQADHFYGSQALYQIWSFGITGGCLLSPDTSNFGNDLLTYCSKFKSTNNALHTLSIFVYYSDSLINPSIFNRAASFWLQPSADPNHYIIASLTYDKKLEILSYYGTTLLNSPMPLVNNNWYKLNFAYRPLSFDAFTQISIQDFGSNGTSSPIALDTATLFFNDTILTTDSAISVSLAGSKAGGGIYLDQFTFIGYKSADSCMTTGNYSLTDSTPIQIIVKENLIQVDSKEPVGSFQIFDLNGRLLRKGTFSDGPIIDIRELNTGIYILNIDQGKYNYKFSRNKP